MPNPNRKQFYQRVLAYMVAHPDSSNAAVGRMFHITRERVRQIRRDHKLEVKP